MTGLNNRAQISEMVGGTFLWDAAIMAAAAGAACGVATSSYFLTDIPAKIKAELENSSQIKNGQARKPDRRREDGRTGPVGLLKYITAGVGCQLHKNKGHTGTKSDVALIMHSRAYFARILTLARVNRAFGWIDG